MAVSSIGAYGFMNYNWYGFGVPYYAHTIVIGNTASGRKDTDRDTAVSAGRLTSRASALYDAINRLADPDTYKDYRADSSNGRYVEIKRSGEPKADTDFEIEIDRLASGQTNKGQALDSDAKYAGATGEQKFKIDANGHSREFTVDIENGDTNAQVLRKMADAVDASGIGVNAWVSNNGRAGTSAIMFESEGTGDLAQNRFSVSDASGSLVAATGASHVEQNAQDAVYSVNNRNYTSHGNNVNLGSGVEVALKRVTRRPVNVTAENDMKDAKELVEDFVSAYNGLLTYARRGTGDSDKLLRSLTGAISPYNSILEKAGIRKGLDGRLSIDEKKLRRAAESGDLMEAFTQSGGFNYGLAFRMEKIAKDITRDPAYYMGKPAYSLNGGTFMNMYT